MKKISVHVIIQVTVLTKIDKDASHSFPALGPSVPKASQTQKAQQQRVIGESAVGFPCVAMHVWIKDNNLVPSPTKKRHPGVSHHKHLQKRHRKYSFTRQAQWRGFCKTSLQISKDYKVSHLNVIQKYFFQCQSASFGS